MTKSSNKLDRFKNLVAKDEESKNEVIDISRDLLYLVNNAIEGSANPRLSKAVAIGSALYTLGVAGAKLYRLYKHNSAPEFYTIKIAEEDAIFDIVEEWFMDALPEESQRSVNAHSEVTRPDERRRGEVMSSADIAALLGGGNAAADTSKVEINFSFDGTIVQEIEIAGYKVQVFTNVPETLFRVDGGKAASSAGRSMNIVCPSIDARNAVLKEIENQSQFLVDSQPRMYTTTKWGDWRRKAEIQPRSPESVILKDGQMDRILDYLNGFLSNYQAYAKVDIPFRTGILLHGEPGSGKSSTALAIANALKMNVYIVSLTSLSNDEALSDAFGAIPANSIVILEDIDIVSAVKNRDDDNENGVTMTGMLNVLDGFQSPPGVITIMTTNRLDVLDPAIHRPGRVDLLEELNCLDNFQLRGLCEYFMGSIPEGLPEITPEDKITSADVMGVVRKHLPDFENAGPDMVAFLNEKLLTKTNA